MLTYLLALVVGLSSFALYMSAFFYPELYRKGDLAWSGVGLFYALVLWFSGERITGGVLLGQIAGVSLIGWFGWQALAARWGQTSSEQRAEIQTGLEKIINPEQRDKITAQLNQQAGKVQTWAQALVSTATKVPADTADNLYQPLKPDDFGNPPVTIEASADLNVAANVSEGIKDNVNRIANQLDDITSTPIPQAVRNQPNPTAVVTDVFKSITSIFSKPTKNTSTYVRKGVTSAESAVDAVKGAAAGAVGAVAEAVQEAKEAVTDGIKDTQAAMSESSPSETLTDAAQVAQAQIADLVNDASDALEQAAADLKQPIVDAPEAGTAIVDQVTETVTEHLDEAHSAAKSVTTDMADATTNIVDDLLDNSSLDQRDDTFHQ
jgi:F0F1-type ATP synthase membrane subunit b/b'